MLVAPTRGSSSIHAEVAAVCTTTRASSVGSIAQTGGNRSNAYVDDLEKATAEGSVEHPCASVNEAESSRQLPTFHSTLSIRQSEMVAAESR